jgi:hypothetical protein
VTPEATASTSLTKTNGSTTTSGGSSSGSDSSYYKRKKRSNLTSTTPAPAEENGATGVLQVTTAAVAIAIATALF